MYTAKESRYSDISYKRVGKSGLKLPPISLGLWHNFGKKDNYDNMVKMVTFAFDCGITHFDLANNYGFPYAGSAEENFGKILKNEMSAYRDEIIVSTKAGYDMGPGPYQDWGSRKYLMSSLDASLKRMGLEYVDIFYSHRPDPETPIEETMSALASAVFQGKALYVGISNYNAEQTKKACEVLKSFGVKMLIHQPKYSMFSREPETGGVFSAMDEAGIGGIVFSPLAQGLLAGRYLNGIPKDSRVKTSGIYFNENAVTEELVGKTRRLNEIAKKRGQSLAQMSLAWVLRVPQIASALIGASRPEQIAENLKALDNLKFSAEELADIETILK